MYRRHLLTLIVATTLLWTGCGPKAAAVKGVVTLDGQPVEGANVTFVSEDGSTSYTGFTDASGNCTLDWGQGKETKAGTYKIIVIKAPKVDLPGEITPGSPEAMKQMQSETKGATKVGGGTKAGIPGMKMPGKGAPVKTELPVIYSSAATTPLNAKLPPDSQPIPIELKSKP